MTPDDVNARVEEEVARQYNGSAQCVFRPPSEGGRVLVTTRKVQRGEVIGRSEQQMVVGPVSSAPEQIALWEKVCEIFGKDEEDYALHVVWSGLSSLTEADLPSSGFPIPSISEELQRRICLHYVRDITPSAQMIELHKAAGLRCTPLKLERMVELWNCNSLDHTYRKQTSVLSLAFALMNHSCMPSVTWNFDGDEVVLRANADLDEGSELTVSYMEDEEMHKPTELRQQHILETGKGFTCGCVRCSGPERSRHMMCPEPACSGMVVFESDVWKPSLGCGTCGRKLTEDEFDEYVLREEELQEILDGLAPEAEDPTKLTEDDGEDGDSSSSDSELETSRVVEKLSPQDIDKIKEIGTSGRWLAPTSHWLSHRAYGVLKDVAKSQKLGLAAILTCLDQRAAFVRQAYPTTGRSRPPVPEFAWELFDAADLLLQDDAWPQEWADGKIRRSAAEVRLKEGIDTLETMSGSNDKKVIKARNLLNSLGEGTIRKGMKRPRDAEIDAAAGA